MQVVFCLSADVVWALVTSSSPKAEFALAPMISANANLHIITMSDW